MYVSDWFDWNYWFQNNIELLMNIERVPIGVPKTTQSIMYTMITLVFKIMILIMYLMLGQVQKVFYGVVLVLSHLYTQALVSLDLAKYRSIQNSLPNASTQFTFFKYLFVRFYIHDSILNSNHLRIHYHCTTMLINVKFLVCCYIMKR